MTQHQNSEELRLNLEGDNNVASNVIEIPEDLPEWKKEIYRRKNLKIRAKENEIAEANKDPYAGVPVWKKDILRKKDEQKAIEAEQERVRKENESRFMTSPRWQQELVIKKYKKSNNEYQ